METKRIEWANKVDSENGGPAFPFSADGVSFRGMSLRDWFAGQAMAAIISKSPFLREPDDFEFYNKTAIGAYDYADAMLKQRDQKDPIESSLP